MEVFQVFFDSIIFILPLWFGNASPTILGGGAPIDGGKYWRDGRRILGDGKTIRGFWAGTLVGGIVGMLIAIILPIFSIDLEYITLLDKGLFYSIASNLNLSFLYTNQTVFGFLLGAIQTFGGLIGDVIGSFIKRRSGVERGQTFIFLDQLGFLILGMGFIYILIPWPITWFLVLVPITFLMHIIANLIGYFTGIQDVPL
ncbi:CDP-2,3-bis-(O-geranylgeranyl)-sn-glycerol synthase [Candidatus Hodarchaeum mangrovi]